jgi:Rab-like protein 5
MQLKIIVAGPKGSGKTCISNFISGQSEKLDTDGYVPTAGVRILEFQHSLAGLNEDANVEIWDMSGDNLYEGGWKAIMQSADGCILVYNPDAPAQDQQIGDWFEYFVRRNSMRDEQCVVFAHRTNESRTERFRPPPLFSRVTAAMTTPQSGQDVKGMFDNFLKELVSMKRRK